MYLQLQYFTIFFNIFLYVTIMYSRGKKCEIYFSNENISPFSSFIIIFLFAAKDLFRRLYLENYISLKVIFIFQNYNVNLYLLFSLNFCNQLTDLIINYKYI